VYGVIAQLCASRIATVLWLMAVGFVATSRVVVAAHLPMKTVCGAVWGAAIQQAALKMTLTAQCGFVRLSGAAQMVLGVAGAMVSHWLSLLCACKPQ
jgi:hypothetical protein